MKCIIFILYFSPLLMNATPVECSSDSTVLNLAEPVLQNQSSQKLKNFFFDPSDMGFSIGLGVNTLLKGNRNIKSARLENGIVVVTHEEAVSKALWLETNYVLPGFKKAPYIRPGIFFAVQVDDELQNTLRSVALGMLIALKRISPDKPESKHSFNFGFGVSNTRISTLSEGLYDNQKLPQSIDEIIFKHKNVWGILAMFSFRVF